MSQKVQVNKANSLTKLTLVLAKIAEVLHWALAGVMAIFAVAVMVGPGSFLDWVNTSLLNGEQNLACYGFEVTVTNANGVLSQGALVGFALGSVVVLALMAMIFRNVYLILKTAQGKTWFAKGNTPFQQNTVRMFREIGIFFILVCTISLVSTIIVNIAGGEIASGFNYLSGFMGLVFLCVSQFFNYGTRLEKDLDGLV